jgi:hypothetical protein
MAHSAIPATHTTPLKTRTASSLRIDSIFIVPGGRAGPETFKF